MTDSSYGLWPILRYYMNCTNLILCQLNQSMGDKCIHQIKIQFVEKLERVLFFLQIIYLVYYIIQIYCGIICGRVLNCELYA